MSADAEFVVCSVTVAVLELVHWKLKVAVTLNIPCIPAEALAVTPYVFSVVWVLFWISELLSV